MKTFSFDKRYTFKYKIQHQFILLRTIDSSYINCCENEDINGPEDNIPSVLLFILTFVHLKNLNSSIHQSEKLNYVKLLYFRRTRRTIET